MKSGTFSALIKLYLIVFIFLMIFAVIFGMPMVKDFQQTSCLSGNYGYYTPYVHFEVQMTPDACTEAVNKLGLFRLFFVSIINGILSVFGAIVAFFVLAFIETSKDKNNEEQVTSEIRQYGYDFFVDHLIAANHGNMAAVEKKLAGISADDKNRTHFIQQYIDRLPTEERDAAIKRLVH